MLNRTVIIPELNAMLGSKFRAMPPQLLLKTLHDTGVHLANPAFAQVESCADFLHRQFLVILENDDEAFVAV